MTGTTRREFLAISAAAVPVLAAGSAGAATKSEIDHRVSKALDGLRAAVRGTDDLIRRAKGILIIPGVRKAGFIVGGEYGEGSLLIDRATVGYYSVAAASFGLQAGVQRSNQALFFMTETALRDFRVADGWTVGVDAEVSAPTDGIGVRLDSQTANQPVIGIVFGREGLMAGASFEGSKYSPIYR